MKLEDLVLSIEQMQHLKELGFEPKDTAFVWYKKPYMPYELRVDHHRNNFHYSYIPTLTIQEILEMLPNEIIQDGKTYSFYIIYPNDDLYEIGYSRGFDCNDEVIFARDLFKAVYELLCKVTENGYLNNVIRDQDGNRRSN